MIIRDATESDLNKCEKLSQIEELKTAEGDYPTYKYLKEFLDKGLFFVAEDKNMIIGYTAGEILNGSVVYLNCLVVNPMKRGKGVGTKLLTEFKRRIKNLKISMVFFFVPKSNPNSIKFYQKNGFIKGKEYIFFSKNI